MRARGAAPCRARRRAARGARAALLLTQQLGSLFALVTTRYAKLSALSALSKRIDIAAKLSRE